ncbi:hypothetical protein RchiOBHm_Chr3g0491281 [Rosa chinensis]|uniref:Uncharacterized protein n=1 Tax=Rosa chinensis TaxID=74649 RepID=A0A2P6RG73_ROSCH|nr:hypothetical protein RchiOBHm_Chr3g0491281 [Rosa chinensis]
MGLGDDGPMVVIMVAESEYRVSLVSTVLTACLGRASVLASLSMPLVMEGCRS